MKNFSFNIFHIISLSAIIVIIVLILLPFNLINIEQAQRIAKWKSIYENIKYSFDLVNLHEGSIIPKVGQNNKIADDNYITERILLYFNLENTQNNKIKKYNYKFMNGINVKKNCIFYFTRFIELKNGIYISIKSNIECNHNDLKTDYIMFVDINGAQKPNRIGQDIFFISIFEHEIKPYGWNKPEELRLNCSPIGEGTYCSNYYLLGGQF